FTYQQDFKGNTTVTTADNSKSTTLQKTQDQPFTYQQDFKGDTTAPTADNSKSTTLQKTQNQPFTYQQDFKSDTTAPTTDSSKSTTLQKTQDQPFAYQHDFKSNTTAPTTDNSKSTTLQKTQDQPFAYQHDFKSDTTAPTTDNSKSTTLQKTQDQPFAYQQNFKSNTTAPTTDSSKSTTLQKTQDQPFTYQQNFKSDTTVTTADNSKSTTLQKTQDQPFTYQQNFKSDTTVTTADNSKSTTLQKTQDQPFTYQQDFKGDTTVPTARIVEATAFLNQEDQAFSFQPEQSGSTPPAEAGQTTQKQTIQATQNNLPNEIKASTGTTIIFNPSDGSISTTNQTSQLSGEVIENSAPPLLVQNKYGQIITIEQNKDTSLPPTGTTSTAGNQTLHQESNTLDLNGRYIHSHLANETSNMTTSSEKSSSNKNEQPQSNLFNGGNQELRSMHSPDQPTGAQEANIQPLNTSPLSFGVQATSSPTSSTPSSLASTAGSYYQLGSGNLVPDSTVVDQMIRNFSVNKRLETGSVNLKLHPQELGELRMEIKIEHDNVKAHITTQSPHAQEMIDRHMPRLREALEQQGLHLQQIEVTVANNDNAAGERFQNNNAWQQAEQFTQRKETQSDFALELEEDIVEIDAANNNFNAIA
ncbi:MAG: flagellar hook-length control protein FliK, partial [Desulfobulbus sp.]|nr:flagellar hook-length control protein FliK [Desulfobulbus sp.]